MLAVTTFPMTIPPSCATWASSPAQGPAYETRFPRQSVFEFVCTDAHLRTRQPHAELIEAEAIRTSAPDRTRIAPPELALFR